MIVRNSLEVFQRHIGIPSFELELPWKPRVDPPCCQGWRSDMRPRSRSDSRTCCAAHVAAIAHVDIVAFFFHERQFFVYFPSLCFFVLEPCTILVSSTSLSLLCCTSLSKASYISLFNFWTLRCIVLCGSMFPLTSFTEVRRPLVAAKILSWLSSAFVCSQ